MIDMNMLDEGYASLILTLFYSHNNEDALWTSKSYFLVLLSVVTVGLINNPVLPAVLCWTALTGVGHHKSIDNSEMGEVADKRWVKCSPCPIPHLILYL